MFYILSAIDRDVPREHHQSSQFVSQVAARVSTVLHAAEDGDAARRAAACRPHALSPILMTRLTTIFALLPLALGFGPGAQMQQPLAIAVIGGLTANMLFTRLLIPVGYRVLAAS